MLENRLKSTVRNVPDFPNPGINFKDITPIFQSPVLCGEIIEALQSSHGSLNADLVVGVESRGFLFGVPMANSLNLPFAPVRKKGKLPFNTVSHSYDLEYGSAEIEIHIDALQPGQRVIVHDDLLATGGTAAATAELIKKCGGEVVGFSFLIELSFLHGRKVLEDYCPNISNLAAW